MKEKLEKIGGEYLEINTHRTELSQTCTCGEIHKKKLGDKLHLCNKCNLSIQRDLLSAYLSIFVKIDKNNNHYLDIVEAEKFLPGFEQSLNNAVLKYQTLSSSSLKTLGFSKTELDRFALLISSNKSSVSMNIVSRNTESHNLESRVQLEPINFSLW